MKFSSLIISKSFIQRIGVRSAFYLLAFIPMASSSQTPSLSFKGVELGKTTHDELLIKYPGANVYAGRIRIDTRNYAVPKCGSLSSESGPCRTDTVSDELFRIGNSSSGEFVFLAVDRVIEEVEAKFDTSSYSTVLAVFEEKYGKPTTTTVGEFKNLTGATLANRSAQWRLVDGAIQMNERSDRIYNMRVLMTTNRLIAERLAEQEKSVKDAAKSL